MIIKATETAKILAAVQTYYKERLFISRGKKMPATVELVKDGWVFGRTNGGKEYQANAAVCDLCIQY
ncbi:hypothetical protein UFOVP455_17 [uncultured Caudovirales phage]|uniref:Uncharacterized protein n=1 Tax=uncultured Caudovirales phage TaxID=2100421 RepID=A0A6J5MBP2_9CAUD|nr:hypothetical protein UFOVP455_17 [uncultured Caudovirales phage]